MLELANYQYLDRIHAGAHNFVYLGTIRESGARCAIKVAVGGPNAAKNVATLKLEYEVCRVVAHEGVIRALGFEEHGGQAAMVMEYGGVSLTELLRHRRVAVEEALEMAIKLVDALGGIHQSNVIHKDINPNNILFDPETQRVRIADFSISTLLSNERAAIHDFGAIEGTLPYISPEQTGRMNRLIDYRTDYYSLGATLYQLLAGAPPFQATDAMELVHAHIARTPIPLHLAARDAEGKELPRVVSDVVMKLLAKNAEERYQSTYKLKADLEACLDAVRHGRQIDGFVAGREDRSDKLQISQKLYGREKELDTLLSAFDRRSGEWRWDQGKLELQGIAENIVELVLGRLRELDAPTTRALMLAAVIGNSFDLATLSLLCGQTARATAEALWSALVAGFVVPTSNAYKLTRIGVDFDATAVGYRFLHDRVQEAAYVLMTEDERAKTHMRIAHLLLDTTAEQAVNKRMHDIVAHLNLGASAIVEPNERLRAAELNLRAARRGRGSTAYDPALACAQAGLALLPANAWESAYQLTLDLHIELVELEYLTIHFDRAEAVATVVLQHAREVLEKIRVYEARIQFYVSQNRMLRAIDTVKEVLAILDVPLLDALPEGIDDIQALVNKPPMLDPRKLAAMRILMSSMPAVYIAAPALVPAVAFTMVRLTVDYGNSRYAAYGYSLLAFIQCGVFGQIDAGNRTADLAMQLLERYQAKEIESKVYALVYTFVVHWKKHVRETLDGLLHGVQVGLETGDIEYAGYNNIHYATYYFFVGDGLGSADKRLAYYVDLSKNLGQEYQLYYNRIWRQVVLGLRHPAVDKTRLVGESFDEMRMTERLGAVRPSWFSMHQARAMLQYYFGHFREAYASTCHAGEYADAVVGFVSVVQHHFYQSLAICRCLKALTDDERKEAWATLEANQKKLRRWADFAPQNNEHKYALVAAERLRVLGRSEDVGQAMLHYDRAISLARTHGYVQEEALAFELAGRFYLEMGATELARMNIMGAYVTYERWGAKAKCQVLRGEFPYLGSDLMASFTVDVSRNGGDGEKARDLAGNAL